MREGRSQGCGKGDRAKLVLSAHPWAALHEEKAAMSGKEKRERRMMGRLPHNM